MRLKVALLASGIVCSTGPPAGSAETTPHVNVALVLDVDATGSIDEHRWTLQTIGIEKAIKDPKVVQAIGQAPGGIAVAVIEWVDANREATPIDWTILRDPASIDAFAARMHVL